MASGIYNIFKYGCFAGKYDMEEDSPSDVFKVALMDDNHSFVKANNSWAEISANELPAAGNYATGGAIITGQAITKGDTTKFDGSDVSWANATFSAYHAVVYNDSSATKELVASIDFGGVKTVAAGTFTIQWNAAGILTITEA